MEFSARSSVHEALNVWTSSKEDINLWVPNDDFISDDVATVHENETRYSISDLHLLSFTQQIPKGLKIYDNVTHKLYPDPQNCHVNQDPSAHQGDLNVI